MSTRIVQAVAEQMSVIVEKPSSLPDLRKHNFVGSGIFRFSLSIVSVAAAALLRLALQPLHGDHHPYTLFFAAIALTAWYAGFWPSIVAVVLSFLLADWLFVTPRQEFDFHLWGLRDFASLGAFLCAGLAIAFTARSLHAARRRAEVKQNELTIAQAELEKLTAALEQQVADRTTHLSQTIRSLEGVCYHLAHDLRAPLRAMGGYAAALLEEHVPRSDAQGQCFGGRITQAAARMDEIIRCLMEYGRVGHGEFQAGALDLEAEVNRVLSDLGEDIRAKGAEVAVEPLRAHVLGNSALLALVLGHLLSNALKFVGPGVKPQLRIWADLENSTVSLSIQDNGVGIEPRYHSKLFSPYMRLHGDRYPGVGMGLAISAKAQERMGGRIGVDSEVGKGSRFWLELPLALLPSCNFTAHLSELAWIERIPSARSLLQFFTSGSREGEVLSVQPTGPIEKLY